MGTARKKPDKGRKVVKISEKRRNDESIPIVGIGASAGGLSALEGFFAKFPVDSRIAFVIIQHMDPTQKSMLVPLLSKITSMKVSQIEEGMRIEPNCIYVTPPNRYVTIMERKLYLIEPKEGETVRLPIDHFFNRLSEEMGERAIAIVLSGTGSDGTLGMKAVKGVGGLTIAQDEKQATHSGMPASAIASGCVDLVSEVERMPEHLVQLLHHPYIAANKQILQSGEVAVYIPKILNIIRTSTGNDFSKYKQNTTRRRIERRMAVHRIERLGEYFQYLQKNPAEAETLFKDLLIGVTNFFRDAKAFEFLAENVIAQIVQEKAGDQPVRIWVPACATGEEAYSIAILLLEAMEAQGKYLNVQIFATDIDHDAIQFAREGVFPDNITADVSEKRLARFFVREGKAYRIGKHLREMIVFAVQNVIKDPPFSRLDLLTCRNLLIYLEPELQRRLLPLFHYTLNPNGFLFLGSSESASAFTDIFTAIDNKWKIFSCKPVVGERRVDALPPFDASPARHGASQAKSYADVRGLAQRIVLDNYAPPSVLVNERYEILHYQGQTEKYLQMPVGEPSHNIMKLVRRDFQSKLSMTLGNAQRQKKTIVTRGVRCRDGDDYRTVDIVVRPLEDNEGPAGAMMVLFMERPGEPRPGPKARERGAKENSSRSRQIEQELAYTRETLQTTIEELETSNEELKSTNEELQSTNEELQSTNEELETSKEEMHSTNEELVTVNSELQRKVAELEHVNNDISNLLAATDIGTLFLDDKLRIKRFTPAVTALFNLISTDVGRPIRDITSHLKYKSLDRDAREVLDKLVPKELELEAENGQLVTMRILPYRTVNNVIDGVVLTFVNVTDKFHVQLDALRMARVYETLQDMLPIFILLADKDLNVTETNERFTQTAGKDRSEIIGRPLSEVIKPVWGGDAARRVEKALKSGRNLDSLTLEIKTGTMTFNSRRVAGGAERGPFFVLTGGNAC